MSDDESLALPDMMEANRRNWDDRARLHAQPRTGYRLDRYRDDPERLSDVVAFDRGYVGDDLSGLSVLHLQCHIGTDTLSLARLGADVTGLDFSAASLAAAMALFSSVGSPGRFVEANVYDAVAALDGEVFDLVYSTVGTLNWLPDVARWGRVAAELVRPGGRLYLREAHPMLYAIDDRPSTCGNCTDELRLHYPYFETSQPVSLDSGDTYVDTGGATIDNTSTHEWNHGLGEVVMAVIDAGLVVRTLDEHRFLDWQMLPQQIERDELWYLPDDQIDLVPMQYSLVAVKP